ncbi:hypothetical protein PNOK_0858600 [Pyrrhoderma noxium]|uniref:Uncharacterized protein n=1 Tax=Pyrrhoderma noxium TaxID=2282107 RepID=A0A286U839_9AGAM|nr:hypothetical protein PNOK_0858600 [Pyrrhoderma noxium]
MSLYHLPFTILESTSSAFVEEYYFSVNTHHSPGSSNLITIGNLRVTFALASARYMVASRSSQHSLLKHSFITSLPLDALLVPEIDQDESCC